MAAYSGFSGNNICDGVMENGVMSSVMLGFGVAQLLGMWVPEEQAGHVRK